MINNEEKEFWIKRESKRTNLKGINRYKFDEELKKAEFLDPVKLYEEYLKDKYDTRNRLLMKISRTKIFLSL